MKPINLDALHSAIQNSELWKPSPSAINTYNDYWLYVQAAIAYLELMRLVSPQQCRTVLEDDNLGTLDPRNEETIRTLLTAVVGE